MLKFVARHGLVRLIGGRAVPALLLWDLAMLANKTRRIPVVDRSLRRGAGVAMRGVESVISSRPAVPGAGDRVRAARRRATWTDRRAPAAADAPPDPGDDGRPAAADAPADPTEKSRAPAADAPPDPTEGSRTP